MFDYHGLYFDLQLHPGYQNDVLQHNHVAPHGIGAAFLHSAQEILEVVNEREVQLFERNILTPVSWVSSYCRSKLYSIIDKS